MGEEDHLTTNYSSRREMILFDSTPSRRDSEVADSDHQEEDHLTTNYSGSTPNNISVATSSLPSDSLLFPGSITLRRLVIVIVLPR